MDLHGDPLARTGSTPVPATGPAPTSRPAATGRFDVKSLALHGLRRYWRHALVLGLAFVVLGVLAVEKKFRAQFAAEAYVYVAPLEPRIRHADEEWHKKSFVGFYDDYVRTLARRTVSHRVLADACRELDEKGIDWLPEGVPLAERENHLRTRVQVNRLLDTHLLGVSLQDSEAELPAPVVNAVVNSLLRDLERERDEKSEGIVTELERERASLRKSLDETYAGLDGLSERLGAAILDERQNIFYERIQVLEEGLTKIFVRRVAAEGSLASAKARAEELRAPVPVGDLEGELDLDVRVKDARVMIARRVRELDESLLGLGPKHPHTAVLGGRRADLVAEIAGIEKRVRAEIRARLRAGLDEEAAALLAAAERELEAVQRSEASMKEVLGQAKADLADYGRAMFEGSRLRAEARRLLAAIDECSDRIDAIQTESIAPARCSLREAARNPLRPNSDKRRPLQAAVGLFGLLAVLGGATALEALRRLRGGPTEVATS